MKIKNILFSFIVFLSAIFTAKSAEINGLVGQYYANRNLEGEPIYRVDENLNFNWGTGSPMEGIPENDFSVRWTGSLEITTADEYVFSVSIDDGIRMYIDGEVIFDSWVDSDTTRISSPIFLDAGKHNIKVEYYEASSGSRIILSWKNSTSDYVVIPKENFYYNDSDAIPTITLQPQNKGVPSGRRTTLSTDTAESSVYFQWQYSIGGEIWNNIDGATQKNYKTPVIEEIDDGRLYRCLVTNALHPDKITYTNAIIVNSIVPETFYISTNGSDENDGKSWDTPFATLQKAIAEAEKLGGGNIWVKAGEYDFGVEIELLEGVYIYGGFAGTEKSLEERVDGNETVISGGGEHGIFRVNSKLNIKLDGLTLTKGKAERGGAIYIESSEGIRLSGIKVIGNESDSQIWVCNYSKVNITDSQISNNTGRGIGIDGNAQVEIVGSVFESNISEQNGGAIAAVNSSVVTIEESEFIGNESTSRYGGAISAESSSSYTIRGSLFEGNEAQWLGGAIYLYGNGSKIDGCEFTGNVSKSGNGGAIHVDGCNITCENSTFVGNIGNNGGAVYTYYGTSTFSNSTFSGNVARSWNGDAVYNSVRGVTLLNCTIVGNNLEDGRNSAICGDTSIKNCIVWGNGRYEGYKQISGSGEVVNSVVEGGYDGGTNIITENPLLMPLDYYGGNVKVMPVSTGSSAIGICSTESVEPPATDALGNVRGDVYGAGAVEFLGSAEYVYASSERSKYISGKEFEIEALISGEAESYQWYKDGVEIDGATERVLKVSQSERSAVYTVKVIVGGNTVTSEGITIETRPGIVYVSGSGNDEKDGSSWENAKATLQSALSECAYGSQIWVKSGEYDFGGEIELVEGVYIYGGFSGTEKSLEERVDGSETVISGGGTHRIFGAYSIVDAKLEGLTLTEGKCDIGSVLYLESSENILIKGVKITGNESDSQIWVCNYSKVNITDSQISNNTGRGIGIDGNAQVEIVGSVFESNISEQNGGAIAAVNSSVVTIEESEFIGNESTSRYGGAISAESSSSYTIRGSLFEGNEAQWLGGAIYLYGNGSKIDGCEFTGNVSKSGNGGAIHVDGCNITCENSTFVGNIGNNGGAVYTYYGTSTFSNSTFSGNVARSWNGDAVYNSVRGVTLLNCTIVGNNLEDGRNSAICGDTSIKNCIVWGNGRYEGYKQISGSGEVVNSVVEGGYDGGTNIITKNPLLMPLDYYGGNVKTIGVSFSSCAINAGATQSELGSGVTLPTVDARGADRTAFERPCIGAFEPQVSDIHSELSITTLYGDDYFLEDYEFILSLMMFETRILDTDELLIEWYKDDELFYSSLDSLILSDMLSVGSATYRAEMTLNGQTYSTEEFEIKTVPGVVYVSCSGDDSNDGKTPETAKCSLDALLRELPYGRPYVINVISNVSDGGEENSVFTINGMYDIPDGVTLNIGDNCILKFTDNAGLNVLSGGTLNVGNSVVFTHIADDSIGGDTNADEGRSLPQYDKYTISGSGNIAIAEDCDWRYKSFEYGGTLSVSQIWQSGKVYHITSDLVIPENVSLNILEGAILKFDSGKRITVDTGGELFINGTLDSPVIFTSIKDDTRGGDTNGDGDKSIPSMGDWKNLQIFGKAEINYANFYYGGNTDNGSWTSSQGGALAYLSGSSGRISNCGIYDVKYDGIINYASGLAIENTTIAYCSRFINSLGGDCSARNCVFYYATGANSGGAVLAHGGNISMINCVVSYVTSGTFTYSNVVCSNNLFYNPKDIGPQSCSYVGANGNLWGDPLFRNIEILDFTLTVGSPCIDAGAGEYAPESDYFGQPRVQDSHVSGVGTSSANGAIPDIGIHEMTENAMSEVDIAANWIKYPETVSVGEYIDVVWMGTNVGSKEIQGNCKTTLSLVNDSTAEELELGQITNLINLAPSESGEFSAKIKVPQTAQDGVWKIKMVANSNRGIFEGRNTDNNTIVGDASINVEMPIFEGNSITVGANSSATIKFSASESARCILITSPENLKIYGAARYVPNAQTFALEATNCGNGIYALTIPASSESFYITFINESINSKTAAIEVGENSLSILGTSIDKLPNNGNVTFSIYGIGFSDKSTVTVSNSSGSKLPTANVKFVSENELSVTLSPEYAQAGDYELVVNDGINGTAYDKHMTVLQTSKGPILEYSLEIPNSVRAGRSYIGYIKYKNIGDSNMDPPIFWVTNNTDGLSYADTPSYRTKTLMYLGGGKGYNGVISPGEEHKIEFIYYVDPQFESVVNIYSSVDIEHAGNMSDYDFYNEWGSFNEFIDDMGRAYYALSTIKENPNKFDDIYEIAKLLRSGENAYCIYGKVKSIKGLVEENVNIYLQEIDEFGVPVRLIASTKVDSNGLFYFSKVPDKIRMSIILEDCEILSINGKENVYIVYDGEEINLNVVTAENLNLSGKIKNYTENLYSEDEYYVLELSSETYSYDKTTRILHSGEFNFSVPKSGVYRLRGIFPWGIIDENIFINEDETILYPNIVGSHTVTGSVLKYNTYKTDIQSNLVLISENGNHYSTEVLEDGTFRLENVPPDIYEIYLEGMSYSYEKQELKIEESVENYSLLLIPSNGEKITGYLKNEDGAVIANAKISFFDMYDTLVSTVSDENGYYEIEGVGRGEWYFIVSYDDGEKYSSSLKKDINVLELNITLKNTSALKLRSGIFEAAGTSLADFLQKPFNIMMDALESDEYKEGKQLCEEAMKVIMASGIEPPVPDCEYNKRIYEIEKRKLQGEMDIFLTKYKTFSDMVSLAGNGAMSAELFNITAKIGETLWDRQVGKFIGKFAKSIANNTYDTTKLSSLKSNLKRLINTPLGSDGVTQDDKAKAQEAYNDLSSLFGVSGDWESAINYVSSTFGDLNELVDFSNSIEHARQYYEKLEGIRVRYSSNTKINNILFKPIQTVNSFINNLKNYAVLYGAAKKTAEECFMYYFAQKNLDREIPIFKKAIDDFPGFLYPEYHSCPPDCDGKLSDNQKVEHDCPCEHVHTHIPCPPDCKGLRHIDKHNNVSYKTHYCYCEHGESRERPESIDPNEMSGPAGVGDDRKVLPGQWLDFKIHFENHSDATAAAQEIHITNMLSNYLDWSTFELGEIVFKNQIVTSLSGKNSGSAEVALSDGSQNVRMEFSLDPVTGKAYWYMRSVDPNTADGWPLDPYAGFLPPNDANGNGEGYVAYRVKVKDDAPNGAMVDSTASIIFDYNEPIQTDPSWSNTVYVGAPSKPELTTIGEIVNGSTTLSWTAADFASSYDVYIWKNGTERPSEATISDIQSTSISFNLEYINGNSYNFLVVAKNKYGETQSQISTAETKKVETYAKWSADNLIGFTADKRAKNVSSYNDNITNLEKYVFGLSGQKPTSFNENGNFKTYVGDDGVVRVRYPMRRYMSDASVKVSYSTDLKTWKTDQISTTLISEDEEISIYESELGGNQPKNIWFKVEAKEKN